MKTIYFGHSRMTYDTQMEIDGVWVIINNYPDCRIVNPNIPEHQDKCRESIGDDLTPGLEIGYFLDLTEPCDIGCFLQYYLNKWSAGSAAEANHMLSVGKPVYQIDLIYKKLIPVIEPVDALTFEETLDKLVEKGITEYL